jgi:hypothetical protein
MNDAEFVRASEPWRRSLNDFFRQHPRPHFDAQSADQHVARAIADLEQYVVGRELAYLRTALGHVLAAVAKVLKAKYLEGQR